VSTLVETGTLPEEKIRPLIASTFEIAISKEIYSLYLDEHQGNPLKPGLPLMPIEETSNWQYFYWKARTLARHNELWASLNNFISALRHGGEKIAEVHFCIANVFKDLNLTHAAIGHYQEAFALEPNNSVTAKMICKLLTR
jgi:hypothetical protein